VEKLDSIVGAAGPHAAGFCKEIADIATHIDTSAIDRLAMALVELRARDGRLFFLGVGGSAGNCSHAVNDFRKLCGIESYAPTDNVSELTARTNDEGFETIFDEYLKVSRANDRDAIFIFSVGGGNAERNVSVALIRAVDEAKARGLKIFGVIGRDGGYTKQVGDEVVIVPTVNQDRITPHAEAYQAVVWHCLVSHPMLQRNATKW
jgi:D-sedoheptulose 7-phosphate isomerase